MDYKEQIKSPKWQRKRLRIFSRDKFTCRCCKKADVILNVHHLYYKPNTAIYDYDNDALVTVCESCHEILTNELPKLSGHIAFKILCGKIKNLKSYG